MTDSLQLGNVVVEFDDDGGLWVTDLRYDVTVAIDRRDLPTLAKFIAQYLPESEDE